MIEDRVSLRSAFLMLMSLLIFSWGIIGLVLFGCSSSASRLPTVFDEAVDSTAERALRPPIIPAVRAFLEDEIELPGNVRRIEPRTACEASIPLPYIIYADASPKVGVEWQCLFVTSVSTQPPEPDWFMWLVLSTHPPSADLPIQIAGLPGCDLLINPDQLISVPPGFEAPPGSLLTREAGRGRLKLRWTPAGGMAGQKVWMQLLVHAPGRSPGGFLVSFAIEITVGN